MSSCAPFLLRGTLGAAFLVAAAVQAGEGSRHEKKDVRATADFARGDATSDPLALLLRAPAIRSELALRQTQVDSLDRLLDGVGEPLWRLRDAQFRDAETSKAAWQLIDRLESSLGDILNREQQTRLRRLLVQARGFHALLSHDVITGLRLAPDRVRQIAEVLEETRKETQRLLREASVKGDVDRSNQAEKLAAAERKKVLALLTDDQKRRWQLLLANHYDFSRLPLRYARAPEVRGVEEWINSTPRTLAELRGKVVVLHFFTFGCINCVHNQPAYKDWHERFSSRGTVVLGIHTPEGESDRNIGSIRKALQDQGIVYPVAVDNKKENWTAWANHTWPSVYLIDKEGYVRYWWYGELNWQGAQGEKLYRKKILELLAEGT